MILQEEEEKKTSVMEAAIKRKILFTLIGLERASLNLVASLFSSLSSLS